MIEHVYRRAQAATLPDHVVIATDSIRIADSVRKWDGNVIMTSSDCISGTDRIASIADQLDAEIIVNVQGDEPLIDPDLIDNLIKAALTSSADMVLPVRRIQTMEELISLASVKAVLLKDNRVLYFSRSAVPVIRDLPLGKWIANHNYWVVIGTSAFRKSVLMEYRGWGESRLEVIEKIEQCRFLEEGKEILAVETNLSSIAVDLPEDLEKVRGLVSTGSMDSGS